MLLLLDEGLPRSAAVLLRQASIDAVHVGEVGMHAAPDDQIILQAAKDNRTIVTLDADFHAIMARSGARNPSILRIREEGLKGREIADLILLILKRFAQPVADGCLLTYEKGNVRYRALPLF